MCDIEVLHSLAPGAKILVYFLPNSIASFVVHSEVSKKADIVSISWGVSESQCPSKNDMNIINTYLAKASAAGTTIFMSAGDNGAFDTTSELNVNFAASSPHTIAVGGTTLVVSKEGQVKNETAWGNEETYNMAQAGHQQTILATGGGFSDNFSKLKYQHNTTETYNQFSKTTKSPVPHDSLSKLGIPDVSANAAASTGYVTSVHNNVWQLNYGTSLSTPLWAALFARCNQKFGDNLAKYIHVQKSLYELAAKGIGFNDITEGNNGYYFASKGWDPVTGLGSPKGEELCDALISLAQKSKETVNGEQQAPLTSDIKQQGSSELDSSTEEHNHEEL